MFARGGKLTIGNKTIETPVLWLGHVINANPEPWTKFHMENLIVNAHDILKRPNACEKICKKGIHKYLNFDGLIMMDSGGFLFQKKEELNIDPSTILELYEKAKPDIGVVLDHPLDPMQSDNINKKRWESTLKNTEYMIDNNGKIALMPVLHGYNFKDLRNACEEIKKINDDPQLVGLGSLVPLIFNTKGASRFDNRLKFVIDAIKLIRQEFPNALLHTFGVGSAKTMHLMYSLGVDSLDSTGWRIKAAYGTIQLPGVGDRHPVSRNNGRPCLSYKEKKILELCECPSCQNRTIDERIKLLNEDFKSRALHNAWVFTKEQNYFRKSLEEGTTKSFTKKRLNKGIFSKPFQYILEQKENKSLEGWY